jgi:hypothetical protein
MSKRILCSCAAALSLLLFSTARLPAQTTGDQVIHACYVPLVGLVYRIKAPGLPTACLARSHVEFEWNAQGPKGDRGETGPAGNLALAGQNCPLGYFVAGYNSTGGLVCRNTSGEEPPLPSPVPPPPSPLNGTWTVSPTLVSHCTAAGLSGTISITGLTSSVNSPNQLTLALTGVLSFAGQSSPFTFGSASIPVTDPPTFPITVSLQGTSPPTTGAISGTVAYTISGSFSSLTSFSAFVDITIDNHLALTLFGSAVPLVCERLTGNVTGSRAP